MRIFLALALIIFCAIKAYEYFYKDDDSDNLINLLQQPKNIKSRDFTSLFSHVNNRIENVARQTDTQTIQEPQESKEELKEQTPLMLGAILNNSALINNVWYKKGDIINNSNSNFIIIGIYQYNVKLKNMQDSSILTLEVFKPVDGLYLKIN